MALHYFQISHDAWNLTICLISRLQTIPTIGLYHGHILVRVYIVKSLQTASTVHVISEDNFRDERTLIKR